MKIKILESIIGLLLLGLTNGRELKLHKTRSNEDESAPPLATTESPAVNVSKVLANYEGLNLIHNADQKTIGFANVTENVAVTFTVEDESINKVIVDSKTGRVICYKDLNEIVLVQNDEFKGDILKSLTLILQNFIYKKEQITGHSSKIESSSEDALTIWSDVYLHLGHPKKKGSNDFRSLKYLKIFAKRLNHLYGGPLRGLLEKKGPFPLKQNLNRFITISIGLKELFVEAQGGLKNILSKNVVFEVNPLFNAKNGAEVLVYVFRQTGAKFDLSVLWGNLLNNVDKLLDIIGKLGGGESTNGVDETFAIISRLWAAIHLNIPITDFVRFLFESASEDHWSQADDGDFKQVLKDIKNITDEQSKKYDSTFKVSGFSKFFTNLTTNQLIENNVNISELVEEWRKRDVVGGMKTITHLTSSLFNPEKYSNLFFDSFVAFLNSTSDPEAVKKILPGVSPEEFTNKNDSLLKSISKNYNIDDQLKKGVDPSQVFNGIPIFSEFSKTFRDSLGRDFDYSKILNGGGFNDYLSKLNVQQPFKSASDAFSKFIQGSSGAFNQIFVNPIRHILPIPNIPILPGMPKIPIPGSSDSPSVPMLPPGLLPVGSVEPIKTTISEEDNSKEVISAVIHSTKKPHDEDSVEPIKTTISEEDNSKEVVSAVIHSTKKPRDEDSDDDGAELTINENSSTVSSRETERETHLTGSISKSTTPSDDLEVTEGEDIIKTTKKKCEDDCVEETKSTPKLSEVSVSTEGEVEFKKHHNKHHHKRNHQNKNHHIHHDRHHGHHSEKKQKTEHKNKHLSHENKHHKQHQTHDDKNHNDKIKQRKNSAESQQVKSQMRNSNNHHEEKRTRNKENRHLVKHHEKSQKNHDSQY